MEWHVVQMKAEIATGKILEAHWTLLHVEEPHNAYRYGLVTAPTEDPDNPPADPVFDQHYQDITEEQAIAAVKEILGPDQVAALEQSCLDEIVTKQNPVTISGVPWAPPPPPLPPEPTPAPPPSPEPAPAPITNLTPEQKAALLLAGATLTPGLPE